MDWLKSILQSLPLDKISDILGEIVIWWSQMVKDVPPADLPMYAYLGGTIVVLVLWVLVARMLPKPLGGISWVAIFAILLAPGTALGDPSQMAPASISVVYAVMMKDTASAIGNALPVMVVLVVGLFIGFIWQLIRGAFESSLNKARVRSAQDATATMQLAGGNYMASLPDNEAAPIKTPKKAPSKKKPKTMKYTASGDMVPVESEKKETKTDDKAAPEKTRPTEVAKSNIKGFYSKKDD